MVAAAGPGIKAEVQDWNGADDTVAVKICGDSMSPTFEDGQVITMRHKRVSRSPYMRKGLIYLVQLDGEWMVKEYGTRRPRADEKEAEYLTNSRTLGVLKSHNKNYPPVDINAPFEWAAWYAD